MASVKRRPQEDIDHMVKRFKRKVKRERIIEAYKIHQEYNTPGEKRRSKRLKAAKAQRKRLALLMD